MAWLTLIIAGCCEMVGVTALEKISRKVSWRSVGLLATGFICSFSLLKLAMNTIPMSTAYAVWSGIGTAGSALLGMIIYNESKSLRRVVCISLIVLSVVGLKLVS
ncbi:DMT family transporter [Tuberibacillus sp. Marseille-P3662]|uniref:DMT family transporter n=1 Tax=Tuberibacillus sp. Marseille-P3662 TaxID=1965358 RepID=UPI000A1CAF80|nr:multidrug efflux SMR transporter [Tuberibacillus sp. Marseille-P3662]